MQHTRELLASITQLSLEGWETDCRNCAKGSLDCREVG